MLKRKNKMVNVRFTGDEYAALVAACERRGENISELIRTTMQQVFPNDPRTGNRDLLDLWNRVQALSDEVEELRRLVVGQEESKTLVAAHQYEGILHSPRPGAGGLRRRPIARAAACLQ